MGSRPNLRCRWEQAQLLVAAGRVDVARGREVHALRAANMGLAAYFEPKAEANVHGNLAVGRA